MNNLEEYQAAVVNYILHTDRCLTKDLDINTTNQIRGMIRFTIHQAWRPNHRIHVRGKLLMSSTHSTACRLH